MALSSRRLVLWLGPMLRDRIRGLGVWAFSSCEEQGLLSSHGARAWHCGAFSRGPKSPPTRRVPPRGTPRVPVIRSHLFIFAFISNILGGGS